MRSADTECTLLGGLSDSYVARLRNRVESRCSKNADGCWHWTGNVGMAPNNYGYTYVNSRFTGAHRLAYALFVKDFPTRLHVLHRCDNPQCINPDHLFTGTNADNCADRASKLRGPRNLNKELVHKIVQLNDAGKSQYDIAKIVKVRQSCVRDVLRGHTYKSLKVGNSDYKRCRARGEKCGLARLTENQVVQIKKLLREGVSCSNLANKFGVWKTTIYDIRNGKTWRHVN